MSYNGSGTFLINSAGQPVVANTVISATVFNALTSDLATGLSTAITKDGQTTITNNIPFGSNKITGLGSGTAAADAANLGQVQSTVAKLITVTGTDTITGSMSPQLTAYAAGQLFYFVANAANTSAVTLNIDSLGAKSITRDGSSALAAGDINSGEVVVVIYDGTRFQMINAANSFGNTTINGTLTVTGNAGFQANVSITSALSVGGVFAVTGAATFTANPTLSGGTANGVLYLNGSKVATSGSALVFDGTNLGIGTSSPGSKLEISASNPFFTIYNTNTGDNGITWESDAASGASRASLFVNYSNAELRMTAGVSGTSYFQSFYTNGSERMRLDSSGNLGLGVTPSAWNGYKAFQIGAGSSLAGWATDAGTDLSANAFYQSGWKYIATAAAARYQITSTAEHRWHTAPSGTAGNAITFTQAMTLDANGNLGVGTTSPANKVSINQGSSSTAGLLISGTSSPGLLITETATPVSSQYVNDTSAAYLGTTTNHPLVLRTNTTERARITSGGYSKFSNDGNYSGSTGIYHEFYQTGNNSACFFRVTNGSFSGNVIEGQGDRTTTNSSFNLINVYNGNISGQFIVRDSGNALNTNNSYAGTSDIKLKQDIIDASSQWDDIKSLRIRKYRFKHSPDAPLQIGLVAQEAEVISPGLVDEHIDRDEDGNDLGTTTKSVKYSILYMKAVKALQEAMARIEQLEAKVAVLESK